MPTAYKLEQVKDLTDLLRTAEIAVGAAYQGMRVSEQTQLRRLLAGQGVQLRVVKNTLLRLAASQAGRQEFAALADGPTALVVSADPVTAAKVLAQYRREHPTSVFAARRAVVSGQLVNSAYVDDLATVPPRDELMARIAGGLTAKISSSLLVDPSRATPRLRLLPIA